MATLRIRAQDTPAFLYALSTALALQHLSARLVEAQEEERRSISREESDTAVLLVVEMPKLMSPLPVTAEVTFTLVHDAAGQVASFSWI